MSKSRNAKYWHEFQVGEVIETSGRTIESGDVNLFAGLSGDFNPVHVNQIYAEKGMFGVRIGHGLLTLAVTSGQMNQTGSCRWKSSSGLPASCSKPASFYGSPFLEAISMPRQRGSTTVSER